MHFRPTGGPRDTTGAAFFRFSDVGERCQFLILRVIRENSRDIFSRIDRIIAE